MARPIKCRKVGYIPECRVFKPAGIPAENLETIILSLDEFEAVRLADYEALYQEEAAERMNVSRQTFGNIIKSAHNKISDAIINGKALRIEGGDVTLLHDEEFYCRKRRSNGECNQCSQRESCTKNEE